MRLKWLSAWRLQHFFQLDKFNLPVIRRHGNKVADKTQPAFFLFCGFNDLNVASADRARWDV